MADNLNAAVGLDTTAFRTGVSELKNQIKVIENSFRASAAVMGDWSSSTQGLSSRVSSLQDKLTLQRKALDTLNSAYQKAVSEQGADSKSAQSLAKQMFDMQGKIKGTEGQLKKYQSALQMAQKKEKESTSSSAKLGKAFQDFAKKSKDSTSSVKSHFSDLKSSILGAVATIGAGLGFKNAIQGVYNLAESASDLVEAQNVVESTFKTSAKSIEAWTDTTAESAGIGKTAATQMAGSMGAMLKSSGLVENKAADMSKALVQLTGDMSSFYNLDTDTMWQKIHSGISGETEPLKQLGINMSEANLQAYAMSQGIDKSYSSMSQSEKTTLRYNYLLSVTKDAQGDFAKTSNDSMANQSRIFQMNIEDMKQTVGAAFLPMINDMYKSLNPLIKEIAPQLAQKAKDVANSIIAHKDEIFQTVKNAAQSVKDFFTFMNQNGGTIKGIIAGIAAAFVAWKIASTIGSAVSAIKKLKLALEGAKTAQEAMNIALSANTIGLVVTAIGLLVAAFVTLWNNCEGFRNFWIGLWNDIKSAAQAVGNWFSTDFINFFKNAWSGIQGAFSNIKGWFSGTWDSIKSGGSNLINSIKTTFANIKNAIVVLFQQVFLWVQNQWLRQVTYAASILNKIKSTILSIWEPIKNGLMQAWNGIKTAASGAWEVIKNVILGPILLLIDLVTNNSSALQSDLSNIWKNIKNGSMQFVSGLKQIFSGLWNAISGGISAFTTLAIEVFIQTWNTIQSGVKTAWNAITQFFVQTWVNIGNGIKTAWNGFWSTINKLCNSIKNGVISIWNNMIAWFKSLPWTLMTIGANMFASMRKGINSTINYVTSAIKSGISAAINWIKNLPSQAVQWGKDMIYGFINGIKSMIGNVGRAVTGVADKIRSILHFSVPDEGPLTDYESWMPDFMAGLAEGIKLNKYKVVDAIRSLASHMDITPQVSISPAINPVYAGLSASTTAAPEVKYIFYQYNNSPKALSPAETARQTRNILRQASLQSRRR